MVGATAIPFVQVLSTLAAQPATVRAAQFFNRDCQRDLFVENRPQVQETIFANVIRVRFISRCCREEGKEFFKANVKRQAEGFQTPNTFDCHFGLDTALRKQSPVSACQSDCSTEILDRQVIL